MPHIPNNIDAIVLCLSGTGLSVARSLGRKGLTVAGIDRRRWAIGHFSKYISGTTDFSVKGLIQLAKQSKPVLFACGDEEIDWVIQHQNELENAVILPPAIRTGVASRVLNKRTLYAHCIDQNINIARTWLPASREECTKAILEARYPLLVKPALTHDCTHGFGTDKLKRCQSDSEIRQWTAEPQKVVLQEHIDGPESELLVYATNVRADGSFGPEITARKLRQWPRDYGSSSRIVVEEHPDVIEHSRSLIRSLGYQGICGLEWKRDSSGQLLHIEMNARPVLWFSLCDAIVLDAYRTLTQQPSPSEKLSQPGDQWQYLVRDLVASPISALKPAQFFCVSATDDPIPGLISPFHAAAQFIAAQQR